MNDAPSTALAEKNGSPYYSMLAEFLKYYPPASGWGRVSTPVSPNDVLPGIQADYDRYLEQCRSEGVTPRKLCAFRAQLFNANKDLIVQVHAIRFADSMGDVMACETKAFGRMLRHLGFEYPDDDATDLEALTQALSTAARNSADSVPPRVSLPPAPAAPLPSDEGGGSAGGPAEPAPADGQPMADAPAPVTAAVVSTPATGAPTPPPAAVSSTPRPARPSFKGPSNPQVPADAQADQPGGVPPAMLRQIAQLQKSKGEPNKVPVDLAEARTMLKALSAPAKK